MMSELGPLQVVFVRNNEEDEDNRWFRENDATNRETAKENDERGRENEWKQRIMDDLREKQIHQNNDGYAG